MKFLALVSGGKDSFFNIHWCVSQGYQLVALANLYPSTEKDDIDSFMFQTVGHEAIEGYEQCTGVPLYRRKIYGTSANQALEYRQTADDEIEDLAQLVQEVLSHHPDIEGVSCGAILSQYQRTRVENVCDRFGLTSLAFLWQQDQQQLMQKMCASGLDARLVKVAAIGLKQQHLGQSIAQMYTQLLRLHEMYDVHVCGEGGEFETLVFDCSFFKKRLELVGQEIVAVPGDVAYLRVKVKVVDKEGEFEPLSLDPLLEDAFHEVLAEAESDSSELSTVTEPSGSELSAVPESTGSSLTTQLAELEVGAKKPHTVTVANNVYISNIAADTVDEVFEQLDSALSTANLGYDDIQHVTLLVADMAQFAAINKVYAAKFGDIHLPPSRVCVQTSLGTKLQFSCKCIIKDSVKKGIHIRSRSFWAPQNIGPYSQARVEESWDKSMASISGQIPLVPATMELCEGSHAYSAVLALQHFQRVKQLIGVASIASVTCFITDVVDVFTIVSVWRAYCEHFESAVDALTVVQVEVLPRNAVVEWGGETYKVVPVDEEDEKRDGQDKVEAVRRLVGDVQVARTQEWVQLAMFVDTRESLERVCQAVEGSYVRVACRSEDVPKGSFEHVPVARVWDRRGAPRRYSVVVNV